MRRSIALLWAVVLAGAGAPSTAAPTATAPTATVEQPRAFGYVIGDIATQRILLESHDRAFVPETLPTPGRANLWFERRAVRTEIDARGRRWLAIDYQLMNAPKAVALAPLPAMKLSARNAGDVLQVDAWPVSVGPLTPEKPLARTGLGPLRPDRISVPAPPLATQRALALCLLALFITLALWLVWWRWRNWRAASLQPFAIASREIHHLDDTSPEAWHALHRAFDGTAGVALRAETLPLLFAKAPQLRPFQPRIEQFYAQSALRFFAGQPMPDALPIHSLLRDLRQVEKRHES